jgi:glycosyltransferase involved in cell wall biosynthesis
MRIGQNPAKFIGKVAQPERITVAVLNYIPFQAGFYAELLDVLKANLSSLHDNAGMPFDLLVFDNGSCEEVKEYLQKEYDSGSIQFLFLSQKNLGKGGAWNIIFGGAPGEIIAYTDNDVLFSKNWIKESVKVLESFPNTGMVTSRPFRTKPDLSSATMAWAEKTQGVEIEKGNLIAWEDFRDFNLSLGQNLEDIELDFERTTDTRITYNGVKAFIGASHWQFIAHKKILQSFLPFVMDRPMGQVRQLDIRINDAGYLRLMTAVPLAMNMSNCINPEKIRVADPGKRKHLFQNKFLQTKPVKGFLIALYNWIFNQYYK